MPALPFNPLVMIWTPKRMSCRNLHQARFDCLALSALLAFLSCSSPLLVQPMLLLIQKRVRFGHVSAAQPLMLKSVSIHKQRSSNLPHQASFSQLHINGQHGQRCLLSSPPEQDQHSGVGHLNDERGWLATLEGLRVLQRQAAALCCTVGTKHHAVLRPRLCHSNPRIHIMSKPGPII